MPAYVRGCVGEVTGVHGGWVFPDRHANGHDDSAEYLYTVRFTAEMLWGSEGEDNMELSIDLFEPYLDGEQRPLWFHDEDATQWNDRTVAAS